MLHVSSSPAGVQRTPGVPPGERRLPALAGGGVPDDALRPRRPHLPRRRERGHAVLRGVGVTGGHPGRRGHRHLGYVDASVFFGAFE